MMSVLEWKLFDFIKLLPIKTPNKYKNLHNNRNNNNITTTCYNAIYQVLCDAQGSINIYSKEWDFTFYQMKGRPIKLSTITDNNILTTLEQDPLNYNIELRLYNLNKMMKRHQVVVLSKVSLECSCEANVMEAIFVDSTSSPSSASLIIIAIGLNNGYILLYKGLVTRDLSINFRHMHVCAKAIKGIKFVHCKIGAAADYPKMFVCTDNTVVCYTFSVNAASANTVGVSNSSTETKMVLDNALNPVYCCTTYRFGDDDIDYYFIVGRDDALYCYTADGRGPCFAIEGRKQFLEWYDNGKHLICILSTGTQHHQPHNDHNEEREHRENVIIIIDIENKLIMLNEKLDNAILSILPIDESHTNCYIILENLQFLTLRERSIQSKLRLLYNKNLYDIALKIICAANGNTNSNGITQNRADGNYLATTYVKYGDYILQRGDYKSAIKLYLQSINCQSAASSTSSASEFESPSAFSIIMKLMDLNHKEYLIEYLTALINNNSLQQSQQQVTAKHMELLKNCLKRQQINNKMDEIFEYINNKVKANKTDTENCSTSKGSDNNVGNVNNDDFDYYPIELINFHHDDTADKATYEVLLNLSAASDKSQLTGLLCKKNQDEAIKFLQKYGSAIMLKYPQALCEAICNCSLDGESKFDETSFRQCIIPILLVDRKTCIQQFRKFEQYFNSSTALYNIWLEYLLIEWKQQQLKIVKTDGKGEKQTIEFEHECRNGEIYVDTKYVLDFLKMYRNHFYHNDVMIICRHYDFWPGIVWTFMNMGIAHGHLMKMYYLFKKYMEIFSNQNYLTANDFLNRNNDVDDNDITYPLILHALNKEDTFHKSSKLIQLILTTMFSNSNSDSNADRNSTVVMYPEFMLKALQHLFSTKNLQVSHIIEHLNKEKLSTLLLNRNINADIIELNQQLNERYELLLNYQKKPIEYRGDICEICKQPIKLPAIFYLCQHSYHKECYTTHARGMHKQNCIKCQRHGELTLFNKSNDNGDVVNYFNGNNVINNLPLYCDTLTRSAAILSRGIFYKLNDEIIKSSLNRIGDKNTNPFLDNA